MSYTFREWLQESYQDAIDHGVRFAVDYDTCPGWFKWGIFYPTYLIQKYITKHKIKELNNNGKTKIKPGNQSTG